MSLTDLVLDRLEESSLDARRRDLVLAALTDDVESVLEGVAAGAPERTPAEDAEPRGCWLGALEVEGFRGIGREARLELTPGPGLHLVCGRNGSGKSSFSEALELLLTDSCSRWDGRNKPWREGWQNLHAEGRTRIAADLAIDGTPGTVRVEGCWDRGADPGARSVDRLRGPKDLQARTDLGWGAAFQTWRPFLSYNELGSLLESRRTNLFDTIAAVLGLEVLGEAFDRLEGVRKEVRKVPKAARDNLTLVRSRLDGVDDERAEICRKALPARGKWDLEAVEALLSGDGPAPEGLERLRALARLRPFGEDALENAIAGLEAAVAQRESAREDRDTELGLRVARLLDAAAAWSDAAGDDVRDCPLCETPAALGEGWREEARRRSAELKERARAAQRDGDDLKAAADWLSGLEEEQRDARFEPIKTEAREIWEMLRARSHVSLDDLRFAGRRTARRLEMDVSVDGNACVALGVMSQGELHSLALSLFLPRATRPESPFRFLFIDDPVQAMDPTKVEGLARVLDRVARTHQVVVFSHDDRLSEAVQRLGIPARIREVHRLPGSVVEFRNHLDPVGRLFSDAHALVLDDKLPAEVRDRVVPGLCRQALEARAHEVVRRRRLGRGDGHRDVEGLLADGRTLVSTLALALFDDADRGGDVYARLHQGQRHFGVGAVEVVRACNKGAHEGLVGAGRDFVQACQRIAEGLGKE